MNAAPELICGSLNTEADLNALTRDHREQDLHIG